MTRHGFPHGSLGHREASARFGEPTVRGSQFGLPAFHGDGRDHVVGGGGTPARSGSPLDTMIALADGTRITFAAAGVSPGP